MWIPSIPKLKTSLLELQSQTKRSNKTFVLSYKLGNIEKFYCGIKESGVSLFVFFTQSNADQVIELKSENSDNHYFDDQKHQLRFVAEILQINFPKQIHDYKT